MCDRLFLVWKEIVGTEGCFDECGGGSCLKCDNGYCCSRDTNGSNGDCPKNAIDALSTDTLTEYRCVKEHDVLGKTTRRYERIPHKRCFKNIQLLQINIVSELFPEINIHPVAIRDGVALS